MNEPPINNEDREPTPDEDCPEYDAAFWAGATQGGFPAAESDAVEVSLPSDLLRHFGSPAAIERALRAVVDLQRQLPDRPAAGGEPPRARSA